MLKRILLIIMVTTVHLHINAQHSYQLPKVLILTTGDGDGRGTVSDGVVLALQAFNRLGTFVRIENRSILLKPEVLSEYSILIVPTILGYHDKPLKSSLTYMSDMEMKNIAEWVKNGGTLVAGENIGRNTLDGYDRIVDYGLLNADNWELGKCFDVELKEIKVSSFTLKDIKLNIWRKEILKPQENDNLMLVPVKTGDNVQILADLQNDSISYPALILNKYGKGNAFLLSTFYMLHPKTDGGLSADDEIYMFYKFVFNTAVGKWKHAIFLSPWKDGYTSVYCQTFDDGGNIRQYERIISFINKNKLPTVFFVTPDIDSNITSMLKNEALISLQGHSFSHPDFRKLDFFQTQNEFLLNRLFWKKNFQGFRFPYVSNSYWGMHLLDELGFVYETSIAANNIDFIRGSVVPYNIPVFNNEFYQTLDLLEISQMFRSDWYFYQKVLDDEPYTNDEQKNDAERFKQYLLEYFTEVVEPNNGVMVYLGHPMYTGLNKITMQPLQEFISYIKNKNVWITSLNEVAERWNKLKNLENEIEENDNEVVIRLDIHNQEIKGLSFRLDKMPKEVIYNDEYRLKDSDGIIFLILDLSNKNTLTLKY